jgi:hypothetical protein
MDIRKFLQHVEGPDLTSDNAIGMALGFSDEEWLQRTHDRLYDTGAVKPSYSTDYNLFFLFLKHKEMDWIAGDVNGHMGGTPYGAVGVPEDKASYSATPLLSLWLSYFRLELGDERT